jgi:hypothetical protein
VTGRRERPHPGNKPVLFVHAGSHKTGTTAIQQTLGAARGELKRQGICWPQLGSSPVHHKLVQSLHDRGLLARLNAGWMARRIRRQSQGCRATILSSERLYRIGYDPIGNEPQDSDARRRRRNEVLGRLRALFADDFDIRVILYLRRVDVFAESMFKELLFRKEYRGRYLFARFLVEQDMRFRYDDRIREFEDCLGPVSVHSYDALKGTGVVPHFCSLVGATPPGMAGSDARIRRSASNAGAWFLLQLAEQRDVSASDRRRVLAFCLSDAWPEPPGVPRSLWPSAEERSGFLHTYRSATLEPLLTPVVADPLEYGPLPEAQFARCLHAWERWSRSGA